MKILIHILIWVMTAFFVLLGLLFMGVILAGRGDWTYELVGGYVLNRINGHSIVLGHSNHSEISGSSSIVIQGYYVTDFCMDQEYIGVRGIPTMGMFATDEELESKQRWYHLIDISNDEVLGPYESEEEFVSICAEAGTGDLGQWRSTAELP